MNIHVSMIYSYILAKRWHFLFFFNDINAKCVKSVCLIKSLLGALNIYKKLWIYLILGKDYKPTVTPWSKPLWFFKCRNLSRATWWKSQRDVVSNLHCLSRRIAPDTERIEQHNQSRNQYEWALNSSQFHLFLFKNSDKCNEHDWITDNLSASYFFPSLSYFLKSDLVILTETICSS